MKNEGNTTATVLSGVGGALVALSTFLPLASVSGRFTAIQANSMIQHGGWLLLVLGVALALPPRKEFGRYGPFVGVAAWVIAVIIVGKIATDDNVRTLYPVGTDGTIETAGIHATAPLGIAVYVAGFGLALALAGILMRVTAIQSRETEDLLAAWDAEDEAEAEKEKADTEKQCPDCAETILRAAKVCKHCGYRF